jgi:RimJ/RimL family protein N-acetyltransferase
MNKLLVHDYGKVIPLFEAMEHSKAVVFSVLEGKSSGEIFVDDLTSPKAALLYVRDAFFYIAGDVNIGSFCREIPDILFSELIPQLEEKEMILFASSDTWREKLTDVLDNFEIITIQRLFFRFNASSFNRINNWRNSIPEGYSIQPIDSDVIEKDPSLGRVLETGSGRFGMCMMHGDKIISHCSSVFVGHGEAEVDIFTDDEYRGKGLARLTACAFIDECLRRELTPSWACWPEREASHALALKLGFEELPAVPALLWVGEDNEE